MKRNRPSTSPPSTAARSPSPPPRPAPPAAAPVGPVPRAGLADLLVVLIPVLAWLVVSLFLHPIGDHFTESDFYGGYADGARALFHGHLDPRRYGIYGPVYEVVLALLGAAGLELFRAASVLSVIAAGATLAAGWAIAAAALGRGAARWTVVLVAATPVFSRYAYSATTDMLAAALGAWALALLILGRSRRRLAAAGALAALAALTRYQSLVLLPIAAAILVGRARRAEWPGGMRRAAAFAAGFLIVALPWTTFSLSRGFVPAEGLVRQYGFYVAETGSRNVQDAPTPPAAGGAVAGGEDSPPVVPSLGEVIARHPFGLLARWGTRAFEHLGDDARVLLGPWLALLALAGGLLWAFARIGRHRGAIAVAGALLYLGLVPAFYSDRYRLMLLPVYALMAAAGWAVLARRGPRAAAMAGLLCVAALVPTVVRNLALQERIHRELPRDVLELAPALATDPAPGPVMSRKGHLGYYAHRATVPFPRAPDLASLARAATAEGARYLYYSWYEAQLRPEFRCLLDTTRTLPGLERVAVSAFPAAVLYRIGPRFGEPGWYADLRERAVSEARAAIWALSDSAAARGRAVLAADAFFDGEPAMARTLAKRSLDVLPDEPLARSIDSLARVQLARAPRRSRDGAPLDPGERREQRREEAREAWREWVSGEPLPGIGSADR